MSLGPDTRYNSNTFGVPPHDDILPIENDIGLLPGAHKNYLVYNIGRVEVYAELKYGTKVMWHGIADTATIKPGETKILDNGGRPYYVTGLKVYNRNDTRAIVHCASYDDKYFLLHSKEPGIFDELENKLLKGVFALGVKYVPYIGSGLAGLVSAFWPENKPSVWDQIQDKVKALVDRKVLETISGIITGDLRYCKVRITTLMQEIENGGSPDNLKVHYMNIAQDLIGLENKFMFGKDIADYQNVNKYILPHYSAFILLKVSFYIIGIRRSNEIGLSKENVRNIKSYANQTIHGDQGANKYITDMYKERVDHAYMTQLSEDLYDQMMNVRSYIATQGLEYIPIWNSMLENPTNHTDPYNDVISYSTFHGRQTANLIKEAVPEELAEPLTPKLVNGKRNKLTTIDFYMWRINNGGGPAKIGGMKVFFEDGDSYSMGTEMGEVQKIEFNGALLNKLEVFGSGALDFLVFHFSDGRISTCGTKNNDESTVFELENHHIVSLFLASDNYSLGGQAANMSVAYQLINKSTK